AWALSAVADTGEVALRVGAGHAAVDALARRLLAARARPRGRPDRGNGVGAGVLRGVFLSRRRLLARAASPRAARPDADAAARDPRDRDLAARARATRVRRFWVHHGRACRRRVVLRRPGASADRDASGESLLRAHRFGARRPEYPLPDRLHSVQVR